MPSEKGTELGPLRYGKRSKRYAAALDELIERFPFYLDTFDRDYPFRKAGQREYHERTIAHRRKLGSAAKAIAEDAFLKSLYETLRAWGIGQRRSKLSQYADFASAVRKVGDQIVALDGLKIDAPDLDVDGVIKSLWRVISKLGIVENKTMLVPCSKALHHLLPDLVVPIDRQYTQKFFRWHNPEFQNYQAQRFDDCFRAFVQIARNVPLEQHVGSGWRTSRSKLIDNAIVAYCLVKNGLGTAQAVEVRAQPTVKPGQSTMSAVVSSPTPTLADAIALAARVHRDQRDKAGETYILHPLRVMMKQADETHRIVAVLHDVLEDSEVTAEDLRSSGYSGDVITALEALTKSADETYDEFIERVAINRIARRVKLADLDDNLDVTRLTTLEGKDLDRINKYLRARDRLRVSET